MPVPRLEVGETTGEQGAERAKPQTRSEPREPYVAPLIEKFPPLGNVTFGTNIQPMLAMTLVG